MTVSVYRSIPSKSHEKFTKTFSKKLEKHMWMNSIQFSFTKMNLILGIFQGLYLKVLEDFFHRTLRCAFVVIVNRLCTVFLR